MSEVQTHAPAYDMQYFHQLSYVHGDKRKSINGMHTVANNLNKKKSICHVYG